MHVRFAPGPLPTHDGHPGHEGHLAKPVRRIENTWGKGITKPDCMLDVHLPVPPQGITKKNVLQLVELLSEGGTDQYAHSIIKLKRRCGLLPNDKGPRMDKRRATARDVGATPAQPLGNQHSPGGRQKGRAAASAAPAPRAAAAAAAAAKRPAPARRAAANQLASVRGVSVARQRSGPPSAVAVGIGPGISVAGSARQRKARVTFSPSAGVQKPRAQRRAGLTPASQAQAAPRPRPAARPTTHQAASALPDAHALGAGPASSRQGHRRRRASVRFADSSGAAEGSISSGAAVHSPAGSAGLAQGSIGIGAAAGIAGSTSPSVTRIPGPFPVAHSTSQEAQGVAVADAGRSNSGTAALATATAPAAAPGLVDTAAAGARGTRKRTGHAVAAAGEVAAVPIIHGRPAKRVRQVAAREGQLAHPQLGTAVAVSGGGAGKRTRRGTAQASEGVQGQGGEQEHTQRGAAQGSGGAQAQVGEQEHMPRGSSLNPGQGDEEREGDNAGVGDQGEDGWAVVVQGPLQAVATRPAKRIRKAAPPGRGPAGRGWEAAQPGQEAAQSAQLGLASAGAPGKVAGETAAAEAAGAVAAVQAAGRRRKRSAAGVRADAVAPVDAATTADTAWPAEAATLAGAASLVQTAAAAAAAGGGDEEAQHTATHSLQGTHTHPQEDTATHSQQGRVTHSQDAAAAQPQQGTATHTREDTASHEDETAAQQGSGHEHAANPAAKGGRRGRAGAGGVRLRQAQVNGVIGHSDGIDGGGQEQGSAGAAGMAGRVPVVDAMVGHGSKAGEGAEVMICSQQHSGSDLPSASTVQPVQPAPAHANGRADTSAPVCASGTTDTHSCPAQASSPEVPATIATVTRQPPRKAAAASKASAAAAARHAQAAAATNHMQPCAADPTPPALAPAPYTTQMQVAAPAAPPLHTHAAPPVHTHAAPPLQIPAAAPQHQHLPAPAEPNPVMVRSAPRAAAAASKASAAARQAQERVSAAATAAATATDAAATSQAQDPMSTEQGAAATAQPSLPSGRRKRKQLDRLQDGHEPERAGQQQDGQLQPQLQPQQQQQQLQPDQQQPQPQLQPQQQRQQEEAAGRQRKRSGRVHMGVEEDGSAAPAAAYGSSQPEDNGSAAPVAGLSSSQLDEDGSAAPVAGHGSSQPEWDRGLPVADEPAPAQPPVDTIGRKRPAKASRR